MTWQEINLGNAKLVVMDSDLYNEVIAALRQCGIEPEEKDCIL